MHVHNAIWWGASGTQQLESPSLLAMAFCCLWCPSQAGKALVHMLQLQQAHQELQNRYDVAVELIGEKDERLERAMELLAAREKRILKLELELAEAKSVHKQ